MFNTFQILLKNIFIISIHFFIHNIYVLKNTFVKIFINLLYILVIIFYVYVVHIILSHTSLYKHIDTISVFLLAYLIAFYVWTILLSTNNPLKINLLRSYDTWQWFSLPQYRINTHHMDAVHTDVLFIFNWQSFNRNSVGTTLQVKY